MRKFIAAFKAAQQSLDERVDEWIETLKEDAPVITPEPQPVVALPVRRRGGHRREHSVFPSMNDSRST